MTTLVTGGAGFIGSNFILNYLASFPNEKVINLDKLTYAGNLDNLQTLAHHPNYVFVQGDITDSTLVSTLLTDYNVSAIVHFAAESHVDRSITGPEAFIQTNIVGTFRLLEAARYYWQDLSSSAKNTFRFLHVSTDEVFGSLTQDAKPFTELSHYEPNSPYSASKAASDHLVRAYHHTYGLPVVTTHCSNNYGPYQFPEKLIPLCIHKALTGAPITLYGDGQQIRDWLYVTDHCEAIKTVLQQGQLGDTYNIGGFNEKTNCEVVSTICAILDLEKPSLNNKPYASQIVYVKDRPGHDVRYAIDALKIKHQLNWQPKETFESGIKKTIQWYLMHQSWVSNVINHNHHTDAEKVLA